MKSFLAKVENLGRNLYLDVTRFGIPHSHIVVSHKHESRTQEWWFAPCPDDEGYYYLQNLCGNTVVDCYGGGAAGSAVITFPLYHFENDTQKWVIVEVSGEKGIVKLRNKAKKKYLGVENPAVSGAKLEDSSNLKSQQWKIHGFTKEVKLSDKKVAGSDIIKKK